MATSQFTIYTSSDIGGPGLITGQTGSLITILDACLVNGYPGKPAAGWSKPLGTLSGSLSAYKQASGSMLTLFVNNANPNPTAQSKESWVCGFEQITSLTGSTGAGSIFTGSYGNGAGFGQFPLPSQQLTTGHVVWRTSNTNDATGRYWTIAADASTFYMWILTGDVASTYYMGSFGDIYSLKNGTDAYKCLITGRAVENTNATSANDWQDCINVSQLTTAQPGHWMARTAGGVGGSIGVLKKGDGSVSGTNLGNTPSQYSINGTFQTPNSLDNSLYMCPLWIVEPTAAMIRGKLRGLYQMCHAVTNFSDGQVIQGSGDFAGKTFLIMRQGTNGGIITLETSATVDTN